MDPDFASDPQAAIALGALWYVAFLFSLTLHEAAHAWAALRLGDPTAHEGGQVSLNPWPHVRRSPVGTVLVPLLSFAWMGWMIGWASAPYDPVWAQRHPRREALMALAGPAANLLLVIVAGLGLRAGLAFGWLAPPTGLFNRFTEVAVAAGGGGGGASAAATLLSILFGLNLLLLVFNLLPVPPLDGSAVLPMLMSAGTAARYKELLRATPMLSLVGLLIAWRLFPYLFGPLFDTALRLLYAGMGLELG